MTLAIMILAGAAMGVLVSIAGFEAIRYPWTKRQRSLYRLLEG